MEKFPTPEGRDTRETKIILLLREKGHEDIECQALLADLINEKEEAADQSGNSDGRLRVNLWLSLLQLEAGFVDFAVEGFNATLKAAEMQGSLELAEEIEQQMNKLGVPFVDPGY